MPPSPDATPRRILIVDDSSLIREAAKLALATIRGWEVLTASSGEEGLARASADQPDAVLLDVVMPGLDGVAVAQRLAAGADTRAIPVVMLTAADGAEDRQRLGELPVAGIIGKPFALDSLATQLAVLVGWEQP
ncbi:MAG TPA: response regulator [Solirubrobacteraceae bacterium]|jgi:CheY-like chemotaxis protein